MKNKSWTSTLKFMIYSLVYDLILTWLLGWWLASNTMVHLGFWSLFFGICLVTGAISASVELSWIQRDL